LKKKYRISGKVPGIGFIREYAFAHSKGQALKIIRLRLQNRYQNLIVPPLINCEVEEIPL